MRKVIFLVFWPEKFVLLCGSRRVYGGNTSASNFQTKSEPFNGLYEIKKIVNVVGLVIGGGKFWAL